MTEPFYKFISPCAHPDYREGDSWQEELNFSYSQINTALGKFATKIEKGISKYEALDKICLESQVLYWTDSSRVTHWLVNWKLVNMLVEAHVKGNLERVLERGGKLSDFELLGNSENSNYLDNSKNSNYLIYPKDDQHILESQAKEKAIATQNGSNIQDEKKEEPSKQVRRGSTEKMNPMPWGNRKSPQRANKGKQETILTAIKERTSAPQEFLHWRGEQLKLTSFYQGQNVTEKTVLHFYAKKWRNFPGDEILSQQSLSDVIEEIETDIERCPLKAKQEKAQSQEQKNQAFEDLYKRYKAKPQEAFDWARERHVWNAFCDWMKSNGLE